MSNTRLEHIEIHMNHIPNLLRCCTDKHQVKFRVKCIGQSSSCWCHYCSISAVLQLFYNTNWCHTTYILVYSYYDTCYHLNIPSSFAQLHYPHYYILFMILRCTEQPRSCWYLLTCELFYNNFVKVYDSYTLVVFNLDYLCKITKLH